MLATGVAGRMSTGSSDGWEGWGKRWDKRWVINRCPCQPQPEAGPEAGDGVGMGSIPPSCLASPMRQSMMVDEVSLSGNMRPSASVCGNKRQGAHSIVISQYWKLLI